MMSSRDEHQRVEEISINSSYSDGVMSTAIQYCHKVIERLGRKGRILEVGPAEGVMTGLLMDMCTSLDVVEGSQHFCESLRSKYKSINVMNMLIEEFESSSVYDLIVLGHVLEHVKDPRDILRRLKGCLKSDGKIFAAVPNAMSLHRQAAVLMGILQCEDELNEMDRRHGHRIVFDPDSFRRLFKESGYTIDIFGGYFLKPVSNAQLEESWSDDMIKAYMELGERYPEIAGEIYIVAGVQCL